MRKHRIKAQAEELSAHVPMFEHTMTHVPIVQVLTGTDEEISENLKLILSGTACSYCLEVFPEPPGPTNWHLFKDGKWPHETHIARRLVFERRCPICGTPCTPEFANHQLTTVDRT